MPIYLLKAIAVSWITLDKWTIWLTYVWETVQLVAIISPDDAEHKDVIWSSSNESIATVDENGLVTCVTPWECTITATTVDWWFTATCSVVNAKMWWFLLVGWGWWGWRIWGGWWAWWFIECKSFILNPASYNVVIWSGWMRANSQMTTWCNWWNSCFGSIVAYWWWGWASTCSWAQIWCNWWSWGWGAWWCCGGGSWCSWQWNNWGNSLYVFSWWWWGWAWEIWGEGNCPWTYPHWWKWWDWKCSCISGELCWYAWWWGWGNGTWCCSVNGWCWWWWNWWYYNCDALMNATYYWWGWWSWKQGYAWCGCQWIFIFAYPNNSWINVSWGTIYECNWYCIHCFTVPGSDTLVIS